MAGMGHAEEEITPFLKTRRAALDAAALGLPDGLARRRVRGLRREEVAQLAGISVDYYTRIEQGRAPAISDAVLDAVARALRLTPVEHGYLRDITAPRRRADAGYGDPGLRPLVRPQIRELLDAMDDTVPAFVYGPGLDLLAWNSLGGRISFDLDTLPEREHNAARLIFLHPDARTLYPQWEQVAEWAVATLRLEAGRRLYQDRVRRVLCDLRASPEFQHLWETHVVPDHDHGIKRILNPQVGELTLTFQGFPLADDPGQRLCTFTAPRDSPTGRRLRALAERVGAASR